MNIEVDINEYLSEEDKREIAKEVFKDKVEKIVNDRERIISNQAYEVLGQMIDDQIDGDVKELIRDKAIKLIDELSVYTVFKSPDYWSKSSKGYDVLQEVLKENKEKAVKKISGLIDELNKEKMEEFLRDISAELLNEKLFGVKK